MEKSGRVVVSKFIIVFMAICIIALLVLSSGLAQNILEWFNGSSEGTITGIVTDAETDEPIPNALMTLEYHDIFRTELTDSKGRYTFTNVPICFCLKNISAYKKGYEGQYKMVAVSKSTVVDFSLKPIDNGNDPNEGIITGIVKDAVTDDPIPDVLMTLEYHDIIRTELTDSNGWYTFTNVPICFCLKNISASKRGYESQYELVAVSEITYVNFTLNPAPEDLTDANSNLVSGNTDTGELPIESKSYFIITGLAGTIVVLIMGFYIFNIKKIKLRRKP
jgi:hypothetical protein